MAEKYKTGAPYKLEGKRLVFTSWYFVDAENGSEWFLADGIRAALMSEHEKDDRQVCWRSRFPNYGIKIVLNKAKRVGPLFDNDRPWDERGYTATILKDGGKYRAWASTSWHLDKQNINNGLCYLESDDGYNWVKPDIGIEEYGGSKKNNFLTKRVWQFHPGGIFIDPSAPQDERYKWINEENFTFQEAEGYLKQHPEDADWKCVARFKQQDPSRKSILGARGAVSPDGIHWTFIEKPLVITLTDTHPTCYYDRFLKKYVAYLRDYAVGPQADYNGPEIQWNGYTRSIGRTESEDFRHFPLPKLVLIPDISWDPNRVLYTNCRTTIPEAPDHHMMFPSVWNTGEDTASIEAASSYDGRIWQYIPGGPVLETAGYGKWDGGYVFAYPDLIELPNGDFALPYTGFDLPHKYPRILCKRNVGYALWEKGRITGIKAEEEGEFTTVAIIPKGTKIRMNALTKRAGYVMIEVLDVNRNVIPGRSFAECNPLFGDIHFKPLTWNGQDTIGVENGDPVILRFKLRRAEIYGLEFI